MWATSTNAHCAQYRRELGYWASLPREVLSMHTYVEMDDTDRQDRESSRSQCSGCLGRQVCWVGVVAYAACAGNTQCTIHERRHIFCHRRQRSAAHTHTHAHTRTHARTHTRLRARSHAHSLACTLACSLALTHTCTLACTLAHAQANWA